MTIREWMRALQARVPHVEFFDLQLLLSQRLDMPRASLLAHLDDQLDEAALVQLEQDAIALKAHQPLQYILGYAYFMDARYVVTPDVLIPRFDTEYLVEAVLERVHAEAAHVLDLCTGSGIVAISLANAHKNWQVNASDLSEKALAVAQLNGERLHASITWKQGDLFAPWQGQRFDVIVSNPPYIGDEEYKTLAPEVHREPIMALVAEDDGLQFYKRLTHEAGHFLNSGGWLAVEIGWQQGPMVKKLFEDQQLQAVECLKDGQGHDRVVIGHIA